MRVVLSVVAALSSCGVAPSSPTPAPSAKPQCVAGEVIVRGDEPTPCDLVGDANTLTILDISEADCDLYGGRYEYEACVDADF